MPRARRPARDTAPTKKATPKPAPLPPTFPTNFRLSVDLVAALDAWVTRLNAQNPMGRQWTRTDIVQDVLSYAVRVWAPAGRVPSDPPDKDAAA